MSREPGGGKKRRMLNISSDGSFPPPSFPFCWSCWFVNKVALGSGKRNAGKEKFFFSLAPHDSLDWNNWKTEEEEGAVFLCLCLALALPFPTHIVLKYIIYRGTVNGIQKICIFLLHASDYFLGFQRFFPVIFAPSV